MNNSLIKAADYTNSYIFDNQILYAVGKRYLETVNSPKINITCDIIDILKVIKCQHVWDKIKLGEKINICYPKFNIDTEIRLVSYSHEPDTNNLKLELSNGEKILKTIDLLAEMKKRTETNQKEIEIRQPEWSHGGDGGNYYDDLQSQINDLQSSMQGQIVKTKDETTSTFNVLPDQIVADVKSTITDPLTQRVSTAESTITQQANQIQSVVSDTSTLDSQVSSMQSSITQQANKIALVVSSSNSIKGASIIAAINDDGSTVRISADKINIDGLLYFENISGDAITFNSGGYINHGSGGIRVGYDDCYILFSSSGITAYGNGTSAIIL
jgi:hypothetical protein